jgi:hypothetical protein
VNQDKSSSFADRIGGLIWIAFGGAVVYGAWMMDRLESLGIPPATAPGVVPALQGLFFIVCGLIMAVRAAPPAPVASTPGAEGAEGAPAQDAPLRTASFHARRVALSWVLCMTYGALLLGRGVPYWVLTAAFLFLHILLLDETEQVPAAPTLRRLLIAAVIAPLTATAVMLVFQHVFLVRLP